MLEISNKPDLSALLPSPFKNPSLSSKKELESLFQSLSSYQEEEPFFHYLFSKDILFGRIDPLKKKEWMAKASACGKKMAHQYMERFGTLSPKKLAEQLGISVKFGSSSLKAPIILFAQFTPENQITIMKEPLLRYEKIKSASLPSTPVLYDLLLGHELFHWIEEKEKSTIYTRTERLTLWKFWKFQNCSPVRALSEIGAMAFSGVLNHSPFHPVIAELLLCYSFLPKETLQWKSTILKQLNPLFKEK